MDAEKTFLNSIDQKLKECQKQIKQHSFCGYCVSDSPIFIFEISAKGAKKIDYNLYKIREAIKKRLWDLPQGKSEKIKKKKGEAL